MDMNNLGSLMVEHGLVIRAIPFEHQFTVEIRHKDRYPCGVEYFDERCKRTMLKVVERNQHGGKFIITAEKTQGTIINYWGKPDRKFTGKAVVFYDSIEQAVSSFICLLDPTKLNERRSEDI